MKKFLLLLMMCVCATINAWALMPGEPYVIQGTESWNNGAEQAVKVKLNQSGSLSDAITAIANNSNYAGCQIVIIDGDPQFTFSEADITAFSNLNYATIDLQNYKGDPFTFTNSNVKYVTLPASWTKAEVKALGQALSTSQTFEAALCQGEKNGEPFLTAYSNKAGSLENAIPHLYWKAPEYKIGEGIGNCSKLRVLTAMGKICAKDISRQGVFDTNGHYVINGVADENADPKTGKGLNTDGGQLYAGANASGAVEGAIKGCYDICVIDLSEAIIPDAYCTDIVPHYTGIELTNLREIWMPEDPDFKTIPADYLNHSTAVHQICIPGNIETIRTRAFASGGTRVNYIWTTGSDPSVRYDNGATFITNPGQANEVRTQKYKTEVGKDLNLTEEQTQYFNPAEEYPLFEAVDDNNFNYGTFTLPAGLKLIERFAFYSSTSVSDVYVLNPVAPDCHVDAFNSSQYHANNTVKAENIREETDEDGNKIKIITRDAYNNGINQPMAMLHYPQETATPNVQRFTDPTREYSIATGDRDGKGNMLYFPTQTEFEVAEWEGTYGYLWNAWNIDRTWYNQEIMLGTGGGWYGGDFQSDEGYKQADQTKANQFYLDNPNPNPTTGTDKTDRSFYDVTADGSLSQPAGLDWYYNSYRSGQQLYPKPETELVVDDQGNPVMVTVPVRDANGDIIYDKLPSGSSYEGNYTRATVQRYVEDEDGIYCHSLNRDDGNGQWTLGYSYTPNDNGAWVKAPWDSTGKTWTDYQDYMASQYPGIQRYDRTLSGLVRFTDQHGQPRFNIGTDYVEYATYNNEYKNLLTRYNVEDAYVYSPAQSGDPEPYYKMRTDEVQAQSVTKQNDYRGWHQFVLAGYGYNGVIPNEPIRSFISDNEWWTICEPYDLRYNDLIKFFGTDRAGFEKQIPYLSKLMYVIRDVENNKITLMFSKNLMVYKEVIADADHHVHGTIDDVTTWIGEGEGQYADQAALEAANPVILHKGVPYLIKPNLTVDAQTGNITATRAFNIYKTDSPELYGRLNAASKLGAAAQANMIYDGEYTVPAYVVGLGKEGAGTEAIEEDGELVIQNSDGSTFTYQNSTKSGKKLKYGKQEVDYEISADFKYTFVGSLYKSLMPQYCYFLGWDSKKKCAAFWYSAVQDKTGWNWNNQTGIICPNFPTNTKISSATGFNDPARWKIADKNGTILQPDDITMPSGGSGAKSYTMDFGATNFFDIEEELGVATVINGLPQQIQGMETDAIYSLNGIYMGTSTSGLAKGVYIKNGKKLVVK